MILRLWNQCIDQKYRVGQTLLRAWFCSLISSLVVFAAKDTFLIYFFFYLQDKFYNIDISRHHILDTSYKYPSYSLIVSLAFRPTSFTIPSKPILTVSKIHGILDMIVCFVIA